MSTLVEVILAAVMVKSQISMTGTTEAYFCTHVESDQ